jgi:hypothetical protein
LILAVVSTAIIGLTVHFWDSTWIFWSMCIGICASIKEYFRSRAPVGQAQLQFRTVRSIKSGRRSA